MCDSLETWLRYSNFDSLEEMAYMAWTKGITVIYDGEVAGLMKDEDNFFTIEFPFLFQEFDTLAKQFMAHIQGGNLT
jgi:hypothetical protein